MSGSEVRGAGKRTKPLHFKVSDVSLREERKMAPLANFMKFIVIEAEIFLIEAEIFLSLLSQS